MLNLFLGLGIVIIGFFITIKSDWILKNLGATAWAEDKLGMYGGSRLLYQMLGVMIILLGFTIMFSLWQGMALSASRIFMRD
ncbi:MAG: hypothetical protein KAS12_06605 [Candidatus Aenigmarchaeota archaeon]|nr:hypothetical protein [Candidatus Aenigmarchaeota archaeon]